MPTDWTSDQGAGVASSHPALFGRAAELGHLRSMLGSVRERGQATLVRGDPGIGKTALMVTIGEWACQRGLRVLQTTGVEAESGFAYAALQRVLRPLFDLGLVVPERTISTLRAAFEHAHERRPGDVYLIAMATLDLVTAAAERNPIVFLVDDGHWLDSPSAEVLGFVSRRIEQDPIVVIVATRRDQRSWHNCIPVLDIKPLTPSAAADLLVSTAPDLSPWLTERILHLAQGNPLGLIELGRVSADPSRPLLSLEREIPLTSRLEGAFASSTATLDTTTKTMLLAAALAPGASWTEIISAVADATGTAPTAHDLDDAVDAGLLTSDRHSVQFRHPLARSAVVQSATQRERRLLHQSLARVIVEPERNLWHRSEAAVTFDHGLADELERRSRSRSGRDAIDAMERAAQLTADPGLRSRRLIRCAELANEAADGEQTRRLVAAVEALEPTGIDALRTRALRLSSDDAVPGDARPTLELISLAEEAIGSGEVELALRFLTQAAHRTRAARQGPDVEQRVISLALSVPVASNDLRVTDVIAHVSPITHSNTIVHRLASVVQEGLSNDDNHLLAYSAMAVGDMPLAALAFDSAIADERSTGQLRALAVDLSMRGWVALELGDWGKAGQVAAEGFTLAVETEQQILACPARLLQALLAGAAGNEKLEDAYIAEASQIINRGGITNYRLATNLARGIAAALTGRYADAVQFLGPLLDPNEPDQNPRHAVPAIAYYATSAARLGRTDHARRQVERYERQIVASRGPGIRIALSHARAALAADSEVAARYTATLHDPDMQRPFDQARLRLAFGGWLRRNRHIVESRDYLRVAAQMFDDMGNEPFANRAREELRTAGERAASTQQPVWAALTPQEAQIAALAAEGLTNRQIGERLFVSPRTVGSHLYRIFPKLGITTRNQIASVAPALRVADAID